MNLKQSLEIYTDSLRLSPVTKAEAKRFFLENNIVPLLVEAVLYLWDDVAEIDYKVILEKARRFLTDE